MASRCAEHGFAYCPSMMEPTLFRRPTSARPRTSIRVALATATSAAVLSLGVVAAPAPARADAGDELKAARTAADELAERWFDAQEQSTKIAAEIEQLEQELQTLQHSTRSVRRDARSQAVNLYQGAASGSVTSLLDGTNAMDAARRSELLADVNANTRDDLDRYTKLVRDTRDRLDELDARRTEQNQVVKQLQADEVALQQQLARAQQAYQAEQAARAAAEARAAGEASLATPGNSGGGGNPEPDPDPGPEPEPVDPPPPPEPGEHPHHNDPFLSCVRQRESRGIYTAVNPSGYYGAYQFATGTWDATASHAGKPELIGVRPDRASPWHQDHLAWDLYQWQGMGPWGGGCA